MQSGSLTPEPNAHGCAVGTTGGARKKGITSTVGVRRRAPGPGRLGGFFRAGDGGRSEWGYQVEGTVQGEARQWRGHVGHAAVIARVSRAWGAGRGRGEIWQERKIGAYHRNKYSLQVAPSSLIPPTMSVCVCALELPKIFLFPSPPSALFQPRPTLTSCLPHP